MDNSAEPLRPAPVAVIGAGWAGCAAAVTLAQAGCRVTLLEAARSLGGRARRIVLDGHTLDNGQHILLGAYGASLKMLQTVGVDNQSSMLRLPLQMRYPVGCDGMELVAATLPAPWHMAFGLLRARGLSRADKLALARFFTATRWMGWQLHEDCSVATLLQRFEQTARLQRLLWSPLCIAALNTPPARASAQVFLSVLRASLGARRAASDMLLPRIDLSRLFPDQAAAYVQRRGGSVRRSQSVAWIRPAAAGTAGWEIFCRQEQRATRYAGVVVATPPEVAADLLAAVTDTKLLRDLRYEAISTCYLQYAPTLRLPQPFYALPDDPQQGAWGQFVFDRGQISIDQSSAGLLAVVISAAGNAIAAGHPALSAAIATQLAQQLRNPALATPLWSRLISEKRATFACTPGLRRPDNSLLPDGLALAGDYLASAYPATLEAAVQSGIQAAQRLLQDGALPAMASL